MIQAICYDHECDEHDARDPICDHATCMQIPVEEWMVDDRRTKL